jgi:PAS domain S-box-containing protein
MRSASLPIHDEFSVPFSPPDWITDLVRSVREWLAPCASFRTVFEEATAGIMIHEPDTGEMVAVNPRACEMFGYDRDEAKDLTVEDLIAGEPPYDGDRAAQVTEKVLHEGPQTVEWKYQRGDGTAFWGEVNLQTIRFRGGRRILALVSDITDRKRYEQALEAAEQSAKRANRFKSTILTNLSHAVRTPLTVILGYADVLESKVEGEARRFAAQIRESGQRLQETYSALLELAELEASTRELTYERVDLAAVAGMVVQTYRTLAETEDVSLQFDPPSTACVGPFDREGVVRIVEELVENALFYTEAGGEVRVAVAATDDAARIEVADTGPGLPASFQARMFEAFAQYNGSNGRSVRGAGIGLTIVKGLVDLMGGTIDVDSKRGEGTTITIRLPME